MTQLPEFIKPMLAKLVPPFSDDDYLYEIKWDGTRAITFLDSTTSYRMLNRNQRVLVDRYPELSGVLQLPAGTVLDGEVVVLVDQKPSFEGMLRREQARSPRRIAELTSTLPAIYVVFDLLYRDFEPVMEWPLVERREALADLIAGVDDSRLLFSDGIVGEGEDYFQKACDEELEGVVAKRLQSKYLPGRRSESWLKVKRRQMIYCAIMGFLPEGSDDLKSLLLASPVDGTLRYVGRVGSGFTESDRRALRARLDELVRDEPVVDSPWPATWVEPDLFCSVTFLERTSGGELRAPVFGELIEGS